jgi:integrase/recombinase XerD
MTQRPGRRAYYADFRVGGRRIQKKLGTDFNAAKSILHELRARAERAEFNLLDNDYSIADLRDAYLQRCEQELRPSTLRGYRTALENIMAWLNVAKVSQVTSARVLAYREHRLTEACPASVNNNVDRLSAMLAWGVKSGLIGSNPVGHIDPLPHDRAKEGRPLLDDEVRRLLEASRQPWRDIWYAYLVTGVREMELANLLLRDVDWEARELIVRTYRAKNHRERRIPIEDGLLAVLKRQAQEAPQRVAGAQRNCFGGERVIRELCSRDHLFVSTVNTPLSGHALYHAFMRSCRAADIQTETYDADGWLVEHLDLHSLRRTFVTNAITNGADPRSVQEIIGHKTLDLTMSVYAKVKGAPKRQAVAKLSYGQGATAPDHLLPLPATGS